MSSERKTPHAPSYRRRRMLGPEPRLSSNEIITNRLPDVRLYDSFWESLKSVNDMLEELGERRVVVTGDLQAFPISKRLKNSLKIGNLITGRFQRIRLEINEGMQDEVDFYMVQESTYPLDIVSTSPFSRKILGVKFVNKPGYRNCDAIVSQIFIENEERRESFLYKIEDTIIDAVSLVSLGEGELFNKLLNGGPRSS
jgi:hypothetical protein